MLNINDVEMFEFMIKSHWTENICCKMYVWHVLLSLLFRDNLLCKEKCCGCGFFGRIYVDLNQLKCINKDSLKMIFTEIKIKFTIACIVILHQYHTNIEDTMWRRPGKSSICFKNLTERIVL